MTHAMISLENVSKRFGETLAVHDISLEIGEGEVFALLDPSGCGKTTLLRMLAGFEVPTEGRFLIGGQNVTDPALHGRWDQEDFALEAPVRLTWRSCAPALRLS